MNFKKKNGYVGIDISIALIIIMIAIPTIVGIIYNISKSKNDTVKKTEATSIAINIIETVKGYGVAGLSNDITYDDQISDDLLDRFNSIYNNAATKSDDNKSIILEKNDVTYEINFEVTDYASTEEGIGIEAASNVVKLIKVKVTYKQGKDLKDVEIQTAIN